MRITAHYIREDRGQWVAWVSGEGIQAEKIFSQEVAARVWVEQLISLVNGEYDEFAAIQKVAGAILQKEYKRLENTGMTKPYPIIKRVK